jgi:hypothetical protein
METGSYLELNSPTDCKLYNPAGKIITEVEPQGSEPQLAPGPNEISFTCEPTGNVRPRARVTIICQDDPL